MLPVIYPGYLSKAQLRMTLVDSDEQPSVYLEEPTQSTTSSIWWVYSHLIHYQIGQNTIENQKNACVPRKKCDLDNCRNTT